MYQMELTELAEREIGKMSSIIKMQEELTNMSTARDRMNDNSTITRGKNNKKNQETNIQQTEKDEYRLKRKMSTKTKEPQHPDDVHNPLRIGFESLAIEDQGIQEDNEDGIIANNKQESKLPKYAEVIQNRVRNSFEPLDMEEYGNTRGNFVCNEPQLELQDHAEVDEICTDTVRAKADIMSFLTTELIESYEKEHLVLIEKSEETVGEVTVAVLGEPRNVQSAVSDIPEHNKQCDKESQRHEAQRHK